MNSVKQMFRSYSGLLWLSAILFCGIPAGMQAQNVKADDIEMVFIASGSFTMGCTYEQGSDCSFDEKPSHQVKLSAYAISKYPVTQKLWKSVMGNNPSRHVGDGLPVHNVTWEEAQMFIKRLNQLTGMRYRLPTEAEWEYAARGGAGQPMAFQFAGNAELDAVGWYSENSGSMVQAVGGKQPNALGLYDMSGNVWEWCSDIYGMYDAEDQTNPAGAGKGYSRVLRGGCYAALPKMCRVSARKAMYQGGKDNTTGFRLAMGDKEEPMKEEERNSPKAEVGEANASVRQTKNETKTPAAKEEPMKEEERNSPKAEVGEANASVRQTKNETKTPAAKEEPMKEEERNSPKAEVGEANASVRQTKNETKTPAAKEEPMKEEERNSPKAEVGEANASVRQTKNETKTPAAKGYAKPQEKKERLAAIPHTVFFTVNNEFWTTPQWGIGFKVGTMKNIGWYFSVLTNFNYRGIGKTFGNGYWYYLDGGRKSSYAEALIGITARRFKPVSFHFGIGYNYRAYTLRANGSWFRYDPATSYGPVMAAGLMLHIKSFVFSVEGLGSYNINYINPRRLTFGCNVGIGFCIPRKKH